MKSKFFLPFLFASLIGATTISGFTLKFNEEPWTAKQLLAPADLATIITDSTAKLPVILSVGPGAIIKNSIDIGPVKENMEKLKEELEKLPRDANIVIYCGCC